MFCIVGKLHLLGNHLFSWAYTFKFMVFLKRYFGTNLICGYQCIHQATTGLYICYHKHTLLRWLKKSTKNSTPQILMIPKYCTSFVLCLRLCISLPHFQKPVSYFSSFWENRLWSVAPSYIQGPGLALYVIKCILEPCM